MTYEELKKAHKFITCHDPTEPDSEGVYGVRCRACADKHADNKWDKEEARRPTGNCVTCGSGDTPMSTRRPGKRAARCKKCQEIATEVKRRWRIENETPSNSTPDDNIRYKSNITYAGGRCSDDDSEVVVLCKGCNWDRAGERTPYNPRELCKKCWSKQATEKQLQRMESHDVDERRARGEL